MPIAGKGMLLTSMDIEAADEADFNRWYDREHLVERVEIKGFNEARRYVAHAATPKYLFLYSTATIDVLKSAPYRERLANPTDWSRKTMARFKNIIRVVARITISRGIGRGAALGVVRLRPEAAHADQLRDTLRPKLEVGSLDGIISMHLLESDAALSGPTAEIPSASAGASDWLILIDGTHVGPVSEIISARFTGAAALPLAATVSVGTYTLMWDLAKCDIACT